MNRQAPEEASAEMRELARTLRDNMYATESVHRSGLFNPNWPLCLEVDAMDRGWTIVEVEDGELVDDPLIAGDPFAAEWFVHADVDCHDCLELVHA